nr:prolyl oligopeptidase family serine peptidase [uncultured Carboxylicivirga sp.]
MGTASNSDGQFSFVYPYLKETDSLAFSAIGYNEVVMSVAKLQKCNKVLLEPSIYQLSEVEVRKNDPLEILHKAINRIPENYPQEFYQLKGFYRELIKEDSSYIKMSEAICKFQLTPYTNEFRSDEASIEAIMWHINSNQSSVFKYTRPIGLDGDGAYDNICTPKGDKVEILGARSSLDMRQGTREVSLFGGPLSVIAKDKVKYGSYDVHFFDKIWFKRHHFKLLDIVQKGSHRLFKIGMYPNKDTKAAIPSTQAYFTGLIYIDTHSYAIASINYNVVIKKPGGYTSKHQIGFGKKKTIRKVSNTFYGSQTNIEYEENGDKWYLKHCKKTWPVRLYFSEEKKSFLYTSDRELFITEVIPDTIQRLDSNKLFENQYNNIFYDFENGYDSDFWVKQNIPPYTQLQDSIRNNLERYYSLKKQFSENNVYNDTLQSPVAIKEIVCDTLFGVKRCDPYHWMENYSDGRQQEYLNAENDYSANKQILYKSLIDNVYRELIKRQRTSAEEQDSTLVGDYVYYWQRLKGSMVYNYYRRNVITPKKETLLDVNELSNGHDYYEINLAQPSPDNKYLFYLVDFTGDNIHTVFMKDLKNNKVIDTGITDASEQIFWSNDAKKIVYRNGLEGQGSDKIIAFSVEDPARTDTLFEIKNRKNWLTIGKSIDNTCFVISESSMEANHCYYINASLKGSVNEVYPFKDSVDVNVTHFNGGFWMMSNEFIPNYGLYYRNDSSNTLQTIFEKPEALFLSYILFDKYIAIKTSENLKEYITILRKSDLKELDKIGFKEGVYQLMNINKSEDQRYLNFSYESFTKHGVKYQYDFNQLKLSEQKADNYEGKYKHRLVYATSDDGVQIPVSIVYTHRIKRNGTNPAVVKAYGSNGASVEPYLSVSDRYLLDNGILIVYPHVRGGKDLGINWWKAARRLHKQNTYNDFIAAVKYIVENKWAAKDKIVARGGSAGGLLMGVVANQSPELFNTVILDYPTVDLISSAYQEGVEVLYNEYGDVKGNAKDFNNVLKYNPYDNIKARKYPNMLYVTSLTDDRCYCWESAKCVARLRENNQSDSDILLITKDGGGHGGNASYYDYVREEAFIISFIIAHLN